MTMTLGFHPLANLFPLIEGSEFEALVADVKTHGVREPVVLFDGLILDGRNRYRASDAAGVDVRLEPFEGSHDAALSFVLSKNLHRRHLDESQRAMVAAKLSNFAPGRPSETPEETPQIKGVSTHDAAEMLNVGRGSVESAKTVQRKGTPELIKAVEQGRLPVSVAAKAAKFDAAKQAEVVKEANDGRPNVLRTIIKRAERTAREQDLGAKQRDLPDKKYGVIYADPEWEFEVYSRKTGLDRSPDNHYPTSTEQVIATRDVGSIAADDCVLFLWTTDLARGIRVMEAWGFTYKSYRVWVKDIVPFEPTEQQLKTGLRGPGRLFIEIGPAGTGFWNRDRDELVLIGTRGNVPAPSMGTQGESVLFAARPHIEGTERDRHSAKPPEMAEWIEEHFPNLPKIELNARIARPNWDVWGLEAPETVNVEWRAIPGFDGYEASSIGQIRSTRGRHGETEPHVIKPWFEKAGYLRVAVRVDGETKNAWVHRLVAAAFHGDVTDQEVDHIDGNRGHNAATNLRICNHTENGRNQRIRTDGTSKFKGVSWDTERERWFACIAVDGQTLALGRFESETAAAEAYDVAAKEHFGEFARLNFPTAEEAEIETLQQRALEIVKDQRTVATSFVQRLLNVGWTKTVAILDRMQAAGFVSAADDQNKRQVLIRPDAPVPKAFIRQPQQPEPETSTVEPERDGPEPIGLYVGKTFVPTTRDAPPAEQFVEQHVPAPPRAPDKPEPMEIPAFLRRTKTSEASD